MVDFAVDVEQIRRCEEAGEIDCVLIARSASWSKLPPTSGGSGRCDTLKLRGEGDNSMLEEWIPVCSLGTLRRHRSMHSKSGCGNTMVGDVLDCGDAAETKEPWSDTNDGASLIDSDMQVSDVAGEIKGFSMLVPVGGM